MKRIATAHTLAVISILVITLSFSSAAYFLQIPVGAQLSANITAPQVQGSVNLNAPGGEAFWSQLTGAEIPVTSTNIYGGRITSILVKMANNGTHILVYAAWSDPTESRVNSPIVEDEEYAGLFYANSTYYYEDRLVFWWSLDSSPGPPPCMTKAEEGHGEGESLAGTGNLWHWKAARTDSSGTKFGKLKYGTGPNQGQVMPYPYSYLDNEFINTTGHFQLGYDQYPASFTIPFGENIHQAYDTYLVAAHGVYDTSSHMWKWVATRKLTTTPSLHVQQFEPNKQYYFAIAAYDGGPIKIPQGVAHPTGWTMYGENEETKSISSWYTMSLAPSVSTQPSFGGFETAAIVGFGMLIVGFVAGVVVISRFAVLKKAKS